MKSSVMPREVVESAARASGVYVHGASPARLGVIVRRLNDWYKRNGFVVARVPAEARVSTDGELVFETIEPSVCDTPVQIEFFSPQGEAARLRVAADTVSARVGPLRALAAEMKLLAQIAPRPLATIRSDAPTSIEDALERARRRGVRT